MWQHEKGTREIKIDDDMTISIRYTGDSGAFKAIRLDNEVIPLIAMVPELIEALRQCITEEGAACFWKGNQKYMPRRLDTITKIAQEALAKAEGRE